MARRLGQLIADADFGGVDYKLAIFRLVRIGAHRLGPVAPVLRFIGIFGGDKGGAGGVVVDKLRRSPYKKRKA